MSALQELIARVEAASGPDREIDAEIFWHLSMSDESRRKAVAFREQNCAGRELYSIATLVGIWVLDYYHPSPLPPYTSSLDAAVKLVEEKLPGRVWHIHRYDRFSDNISEAEIMADFSVAGSKRVEGSAPTPALALCLALLRALAGDAP